MGRLISKDQWMDGQYVMTGEGMDKRVEEGMK